MAETFRGRLRSFRAALAAFALAAPSLAVAADMPRAPVLDSFDEERVTFGSGWYLRGDVAAASDTRLAVGNVILPSSTGALNSWSVGVGAGYKFNEWFRFDVTADWRASRAFNGNTIAGVPCQTGAGPLTVGGVIVGSVPVYALCSDITRARLNDVHVLANGYIDVGTWYGATPYVGGGVGVNYVYQRVAQNWFMNNSVAYNPTWTDPFTTGTYSAYWDQNRSTSSLQFAWSLMAGVSYSFTHNVAVDLGYRYLNLGSVTNYASFYGPQTKKLQAQELRLGLRYTPD